MCWEQCSVIGITSNEIFSLCKVFIMFIHVMIVLYFLLVDVLSCKWSKYYTGMHLVLYSTLLLVCGTSL